MDRPIFIPWWRRNQSMYLIISICAALLLIASISTLFGKRERNIRLALNSTTIASVEQGLFHDFISLRGGVVPRDTIYLDALEGGRVEKVFAQAGDTVVLGQPLVSLSNTALELDVLDREGRLVQSITQLQAYETQLEQNRVANQKTLADIDFEITRLQRALNRRESLLTDKLVSQESVDSLRDELDRAQKLKPMQIESNERQERLRQQQLPQNHAQAAKLQQDLLITHSKLDNLIVRAPATGVLTSMELKVGENRNRGERFGEITPDTGFKLMVSIDEYYLGRVHAGQHANIEWENKDWALKVTRVYPQVKNGTFVVDLSFDGTTPNHLLPGQTLQGRLSLGSDTPALVLPAGAFLERTGGDWIFILDSNGKAAHRRQIRIGRRNAEQIEILSGINPGERAMISDYTGLEKIERVDFK
ncbi:MAG TPA: HlyD family efflux transporter periplasmic adaptor subunit [Steroidobacteraceae bacterium]|nr:HlyD family efflux transporter periplasmic adaptor subunit [Steroidobacteraceae bacterium]